MPYLGQEWHELGMEVLPMFYGVGAGSASRPGRCVGVHPNATAQIGPNPVVLGSLGGFRNRNERGSRPHATFARCLVIREAGGLSFG
jgi:hypothetical protein